MLCDKCHKNYPRPKITKYGDRYLCDECIGEEISRLHKNTNRGILNYIKSLFGK